MVAAIAALFSALAVVFALSLTTTISEPIDTFLNVLVNLINGRSRMLTADEAATALLYAVVVYAVAFSVAYFMLRFLAIFAAAIGIPGEDQLRLNRDLRRARSTTVAQMRRQARLNAVYLIRAQQAAVAAQRRRQAQAARAKSAAPPDPTLADFDLK